MNIYVEDQMEQVLAFLAAGFSFLVVFSLAQLVWFRTRQVRELILTFTILAFVSGFIVYGPFYFLTESIFPSDLNRAMIAFAGLYGSLGFAGIYIILGPISSDRSLSAHMFIQMLRRDGKMPREELLNNYVPKIFNKRFDEYLYVGTMVKDGAEYRLTPKGRRIANLFLFFIKALKMKENF